MDAPETPPKEVRPDPIEWRLVDDLQELKRLINTTLEETIVQDLSAAIGRSLLTQSPRPHHQAQREANIEASIESNNRAVARVRRLQALLKSEHNQLPINMKYKDKPFIQVDALPPTPDQQAK